MRQKSAYLGSDNPVRGILAAPNARHSFSPLHPSFRIDRSIFIMSLQTPAQRE
jgi:hypothetical protein